jgi:hypothetical protein
VSTNNSVSIAVDMGTISCDVLLDGKPATTIRIPNFHLQLGKTDAELDVTLTQFDSLFTLVKEAIKLEMIANYTSIVSVVNIRVRQHDGQVSWLDTWFTDLSFNFPINKTSLALY